MNYSKECSTFSPGIGARMTPDISAIAQKHANAYVGRDETAPLGRETYALTQRITLAIEEATASLRAQHAKLQLEYEHAVKCMNRNCRRCNQAVAQESPLNGEHDENCECATCVSLDAAGVE